MLLHEDVVYQILLWLPVVSLLRFKCVCRSWHALIESSYFIKQHLHLHHYDPSSKDKNQNLIYKSLGQCLPITFPLTSMEGFEEPNVCLQLNCSNLRGCYPIEVLGLVSHDGIICLNLYHCSVEHCICLWNPATKQSRVLPQSASRPKSRILIGFGYDIKSNDYKVVKLTRRNSLAVDEVYSLNTGRWRTLVSLPFFRVWGDIRMPFNNGTCFFWEYGSSKSKGFLCFDFSSEMFRSLPLPSADCHPGCKCVLNDKIACVLRMSSYHTEIWVFSEYGTVNESWTKLYTIDTFFLDIRYPMEGVSTSGNYIFCTTLKHMCRFDEHMCRFNVVTKETNCFSLDNMNYSSKRILAEYKESLVSFGEGNECTSLHQQDSGNQELLIR